MPPRRFKKKGRKMERLLERLFRNGNQSEIELRQNVDHLLRQANACQWENRFVTDILTRSYQWIMFENSQLKLSLGIKILLAWGVTNQAVFKKFFTPALVAEVLQSNDVVTSNVPLFLLYCFQIMRTKYHPIKYHDHAQMVQRYITAFVNRSGDIVSVCNCAVLLESFGECIPKDDVTRFCLAVLRQVSLFRFPLDFGPLAHITGITNCIMVVNRVSTLFDFVLQNNSRAVHRECLMKILHAISLPASDFQKLFFLASVVKSIPMDLVNQAVSLMVSAENDDTIFFAMGNIVEWFSFPYAQNVDLWFMCFIHHLQNTQKSLLLKRISEYAIGQIFENLKGFELWQANFQALAYLLLTSVHSPELFYQCLPEMMDIVSYYMKKMDSSANIMFLLTYMTQLIYVLMYQHPDPDEQYGHYLEYLKPFPKPTDEQIVSYLNRASQNAGVFSSTFIKEPIPCLLPAAFRLLKRYPGKTGLHNLGNTCYMNSVVQALYMCDRFRQDVLAKIPCEKENLLKALQCVFARLSQSYRLTIDQYGLLAVSRPAWFLPGAQQDCSEFLKFMLNQLHDEEKKPSTESVSSNEEPLPEVNCAKRRKMSSEPEAEDIRNKDQMNGNLPGTDNSGCDKCSVAEQSLVERTFKGKVQTTLICLRCRQESVRVENFVDLPLAFPSPLGTGRNQQKSLAGVGDNGSVALDAEKCTDGNIPDKCLLLNDLISFYLTPENLTGDNKYYCDTCAMLQDGQKNIKIIEAPYYLILTLMRFSYNAKNQTRVKVCKEVLYPRTLSIPIFREPRSEQAPGLSENGLNPACTSVCSAEAVAARCQAKLEDIARKLAPKCGSCQQNCCMTCQLYGLCSVIIHSGPSSDSGHYYCYARHSQSSRISAEFIDSINGDLQNLDFLPDEWFNFNDETVSSTCFNSFNHLTKKYSRDTAYVLIYKRLDFGEEGQGAVTDESVMHPELMDFITKENEAYLKEQETLASHNANMCHRRATSLHYVRQMPAQR